MKTVPRGFVIFFAWVGATAILALIAWGGLHLALRDFAGCTDSEQRVLTSPDGAHSIKSFRRECRGEFNAYFLDISAGTPNQGREYTPIVEIQGVGPEQVSARWNGSNELDVAYPRSAKVVEAYAKVFGVHVVLNPPL